LISKKDKIRVIYDASVLVSGKISGNIHKTGLYRVCYEVLNELKDHNEFQIFLYDVFNRERELKEYVQKNFPGCLRIEVHSLWYQTLFFPLGNFIDLLRLYEQENKKGFLGRFVWLLKNSLILFEKVARKADRKFFINLNIKKEINKCDLYYSTYFPIPEQIRTNKKLKLVYTIHDIIPVIHPEYFSSGFNQSIVKEVIDNIKLNDFVICVSESTKKDLLKYRHDLKPSRITVALLAASAHFYEVSDIRKIREIREKFKIPLRKSYLLSVCTLEPRKNLSTIIASFKNILEKGNVMDFILVLTGSPGWNSDILMNEINDLNRKFNNSIILTGFVSDEELAVLYSDAFVFIYLSLYEGFGLPPLESMKCGVPVIAANTSSLPEVIGDAGIMIDPLNISELTNTINLLSSNLKLRNSLAQKSLLRSSDFLWNKTTDTIEKVFHLALKDNG
jgi:glycosyltransferase involved in cell wall biosynthesis